MAKLNALEQAKRDAINIYVTLNLGEKKDEELTVAQQLHNGEPYQINGRTADDPVFQSVCDLFGLDETTAIKDRNKIEAVIEMVSMKVGADPKAILQYINKKNQQLRGQNTHRQLYRLLRME